MKQFARNCALGFALSTTACGGDYDEYTEEVTALGEIEQGVEGGTLQTTAKGAVRLSVDGSGWCSGVIIGPRTVLTAAHCLNVGYGNVNVKAKVQYYSNSSWWCLTEAANTNRECSTSRNGKAWVNPGHESVATSSSRRKRAEQDIAVITMNRDFSYVASGSSMAIMVSPTKNTLGRVYATGYGALSDSIVGLLPYQATFSVAALGADYYYTLGGRLDSQPGVDTGMRLCSGDSGSPQFRKLNSSQYVFGLHSGRSAKNGRCGELDTEQYGVVIGAYMDEIEGHLGYTCRYINLPPIGRVADCWP